MEREGRVLAQSFYSSHSADEGPSLTKGGADYNGAQGDPKVYSHPQATRPQTTGHLQALGNPQADTQATAPMTSQNLRNHDADLSEAKWMASHIQRYLAVYKKNHRIDSLNGSGGTVAPIANS